MKKQASWSPEGMKSCNKDTKDTNSETTAEVKRLRRLDSILKRTIFANKLPNRVGEEVEEGRG